jgi:FtsH-binding integral membrane protein
MTTDAAVPGTSIKSSSGAPGRRYDHWFFSIMALLMLATAFGGFARTYYLAGLYRAPLPSFILHIHGAAFSCWIVLLVTQTSLVAAGRTDIHKRLGIAGFLLGCVMIVLGVMAATDALVRASGPAGRDTKAFYIVSMTDMLIFAVLLGFAFRARSDSPTHKRIIYVATTGLLIAAIARLPMAFSYRNNPVDALLSYIFLVILLSYDLWSTHKIHRATIWASAYLIFVQQIRVPLGKTAAWHTFADWVLAHAR